MAILLRDRNQHPEFTGKRKAFDADEHENHTTVEVVGWKVEQRIIPPENNMKGIEK